MKIPLGPSSVRLGTCICFKSVKKMCSEAIILLTFANYFRSKNFCNYLYNKELQDAEDPRPATKRT